jgi:glycerol-1-phosphate dehydrogenase [NAD(P)+]
MHDKVTDPMADASCHVHRWVEPAQHDERESRSVNCVQRCRGLAGGTSLTGTFDLEALRRRLESAPENARLKPVGLQRVVVGDGALGALPDVVAGLVGTQARSGPVALLSDLTPKSRRSEDLLGLVTDLVTSRIGVRHVFAGTADRGTHADEQTLTDATRACAGAACLVAVGSGTVADIGKVLAAAHGLRYVIVQTADSVNGFADDRSVLLVKGVKRTTPSTWADVLIADTDVLVGAPAEMNVSGLADLTAMFTAPADWYMATVLGIDDTYSPTVVSLAREQGPALLETARLVRDADRTALNQLAEILTLSGISMGIAGTTAPCSGMEHAVSHLLEMAAVKQAGAAALHGLQVGVSSVVAALLWQRVLDELADGGMSRIQVPDAADAETAVRFAFAGVDPSGNMGEECWRDYVRKLGRWARSGGRIEMAARQWPSHDRLLRGLLAGPEALVASLRNAGAPVRFCELTPFVEDDVARWAVASCHLMRDRFSVADMALFLGIWDESFVEGILADADRLGALAGAQPA